MAVKAVIFDWGGTLTPWHSIDPGELWLEVSARHYPAAEAAAMAEAIRAAEIELWQSGETSQRSSTLTHIFERAGVTVSEEFLASYFEAWDPHTFTDPDVPRCCASCDGAGSRWACCPTRCGRASPTSGSSSGTRCSS